MMRVIQVGLGGMGNTWLQTVLASTEVKFAGFVEVDPIIADKQCSQYGFDRNLVFSTLDQALESVKADAVINVTPPQFHTPISVRALDAGLPVLSEKPLADSIDSARVIVDKANANGVLHMVAQNRRYSPHAQTLKRVLRSGVLGRITGVTVEFFKGPHFGGFRDQMAYPLIIDMAIHHFDMLRFFLEAEPITVFGHSWNPSWSWYKGDAAASLQFEFSDKTGYNTHVAYNGSWCAIGQETSWDAHWRFDCELGTLTMVNDQVCQKIGTNELQILPIVELPYSNQAYLLHEFYEAVTKRLTPATTCQDNLHSLAMVFDAIRAFETRLPVTHSVE